MFINLSSTFKMIRKILIHKYYVFRYGLIINVNLWQLIVHDLSKFFPPEFINYRNFFFNNPKNTEIYNFEKACLHHFHNNPHHWQYWIVIEDSCPNGKEIIIPEKYIKEMAADWLAASKYYSGVCPCSFESWEWYNKTINSIRMHAESYKKIHEVLNNFFQINKLK